MDTIKSANARSAREWRSGETHECAVEGCGEIISARLLMCAEHWRQVPKPLQDAVWRTYKAFTWHKGSWDAYASARAAAIRSVEGKP